MRGRALRLPPARALTRALLMRHSPLDRPPDSSAGPAATPARHTLTGVWYVIAAASQAALHPVICMLLEFDGPNTTTSCVETFMAHRHQIACDSEDCWSAKPMQGPGCSGTWMLLLYTQEVCQIGQNLLRRIAGGFCCWLLCGGAQER